MSKIIVSSGHKQAKTAVEQYTIDVTNNLPSGVSLSATGHTATHTPPSGAASTPTITVAGNKLTVEVGPLSVGGDHTVDVKIDYSNTILFVLRLEINVPY